MRESPLRSIIPWRERLSSEFPSCPDDSSEARAIRDGGRQRFAARMAPRKGRATERIVGEIKNQIDSIWNDLRAVEDRKAAMPKNPLAFCERRPESRGGQ